MVFPLLALRTNAAVYHLCGLYMEAMVLCGIKAGGQASSARHIFKFAAPNTCDVVVIITSVEFIPRPATLDHHTSNQMHLRQSGQHVIDRLFGNGTKSLTHSRRNIIRRHVMMLTDRSKGGDARCSNSQPTAAKKITIINLAHSSHPIP